MSTITMRVSVLKVQKISNQLINKNLNLFVESLKPCIDS